MADLSFGGRLPIHLHPPDGVSQVFTKAKDSLNETAGKAVNTVTETMGEAVGTVAETASKTANFVTEVTHKTFNSATETTQQTKLSVTETTENVVNTVNETMTQMLTTLGQKGEDGRAFLGDRLQTAENFGNSISTKVEDSINTVVARQIDAVKIWIDAHPALSWATKALLWGINHPILGIVSLILVIFILKQFIKVFGSVIEQALLSLLKAPFLLVQFLFRLTSKLGKSTENNLNGKQGENEVLALSPSSSASISREHQERLAKILARIEAIRQEQNELLQEVKAILALDELKAE
jgi:hypothetical protein